MSTTSGPARTSGRRWRGLNPLEPARNPLAFFTACARRGGDIVPLRSRQGPVFLLSHPDYIEQVLVTEQRNFVKGRIYHRGLEFMGNGLLTSEGDAWLRQRRLSQPAFHRQRVAQFAETMVRAGQEATAGWRSGQTLDVHRAMAGLTLQIVARTLFGTEAGAYVETMNAAHTAIMERYLALQRSPLYHFLPDGWPTPANLRYRRAVRNLDAITAQVIHRRRAGGEDHGDLLAMFLAARDEDGNGMSPRQLRDEVVTFFLAGHETTANALTWTWYLLAQYPAAEARLHAELAAALGGRAPCLADLPALPYTEAVIKEAMRLYPPSWMISREAVAECRIGGVTIPAGALVMFSQWVVQRDPRFYAEPECFEPARWLDGLEKRLPRYAYFPFGGGPRLCIGHQFATLEANLLLATIAPRFSPGLVPGYQLVLQPSITLRPRGGLPMILS